jgi:hypothetical protein
VSRAQRLTFLAIAAGIAVVAVILLLVLGGSDDGGDDATATSAEATPTATATAEPDATETPAPTPTPRPKPPLLRAGKVAELEFTEGGTVRFRVRSDTDEEIHVHGYDIEQAVPAGRTTAVSFPADITGIFEIEFHGSGEQIASLRVDPD